MKSKSRYFFVFAATTLIFLIGLIIGAKTADTKLSKLGDLEQDMRIDTMAVEIEYLIVSEEPCKWINSTPLTDDLYQIGSKLDYMENQLGKSNRDVIRLKEYYSLLEIRHWLFMQKTNEQCKSNRTLILYFYSNYKDCDKCEEQGFVLNYLHKKYPAMSIYSFDINIGNSAINAIKRKYGIKTAPSLIINDIAYEGFKASDEIDALL